MTTDDERDTAPRRDDPMTRRPPAARSQAVLWWELINEAEALSESAHLGLASVWGWIHRGDYRRARVELDRAVDWWTGARPRPTGGAAGSSQSAPTPGASR